MILYKNPFSETINVNLTRNRGSVPTTKLKCELEIFIHTSKLVVGLQLSLHHLALFRRSSLQRRFSFDKTFSILYRIQSR